MICKNCGNQMNDNSSVCDKCGAVMNDKFGLYSNAPLSKKHYFGSDSCSETSRKLTTAGWIIFAVLAVVLAYSLITTIVGVNVVMSEINLDGSITEILESISDLSGEEIIYDEEELQMMETVGISFQQIFRITLIVVICIMLLGSLAMLVLAFLTVLLKNQGVAIASLVVAVLFTNSFIAIGLAVALLVFTTKWNKEYDAYCANIRSGWFANNNNGNSNAMDFS